MGQTPQVIVPPIVLKKAVKYGSKGRLGLIGPAGSGKTKWALEIAELIVGQIGGRIAAFDSEHGSMAKYADEYDFDHFAPDTFAPEVYIAFLEQVERGGQHSVVILDSLSHAWAGKDGILEFVDKTTAASTSKNAYTTGWRAATPKHNDLIEAILKSKLHVIATMRSKVEYVLEEDDRGHKTPKKIGMQPIQREGMDYEFDVTADLEQDSNVLAVGKTRCSALKSKVFKPGDLGIAKTFLAWLSGPECPKMTLEEARAVLHPKSGVPLSELTRDKWQALLTWAQGRNGDVRVVQLKEALGLLLAQPLPTAGAPAVREPVTEPEPADSHDRDGRQDDLPY